jgi:hypothetical protein
MCTISKLEGEGSIIYNGGMVGSGPSVVSQFNFCWLVQAKKSKQKRQSHKLNNPHQFSKEATPFATCSIRSLYLISRKFCRFP